MSNNARTCPKCGTPLGQKNLCPVCDARVKDNKTPGGNADFATSQEMDYVSCVIEFVEKHLYDWDDEFNSFYDGLSGDHDFEACYEACSKVCELFKIDMPVSGKISGSMTIHVLRGLKSVFPWLTNEAARDFARKLLLRRVESSLSSHHVEISTFEENYGGEKAKVDKSKCAGCESCVGACPVNAISMKDGAAEVNKADCVACGACVGECPCEAITINY